MTERRCVDCVNYRVCDEVFDKFINGKWQSSGFCILSRPLKPCDNYQREPGADDDLESARARLKQREREIRESVK